jgi:hypothetical protein
MLNRRLHLHGLLAVLLALVMQLGLGARVPQIDPLLEFVEAETICHSHTPSGDEPSLPSPTHQSECPVCPLCIALHGPTAALVPGPAFLTPRAVAPVRLAELLPPSTAPPTSQRPPNQPRAPPTFS